MYVISEDSLIQHQYFTFDACMLLCKPSFREIQELTKMAKSIFVAVATLLLVFTLTGKCITQIAKLIDYKVFLSLYVVL